MATHIKDVIKEFLSNKEGEWETQQKIKTLVEDVLGDCGQNHILFQGARKNKLIFNSEAASARHTLNLKRKELLAKVQKEFPHIKELEING